MTDEFTVTFKPCGCRASEGPHYHVAPHDIIPWEDFKQQLMDALPVGSPFPTRHTDKSKAG